jgi:hypothetical protein
MREYGLCMAGSNKHEINDGIGHMPKPFKLNKT